MYNRILVPVDRSAFAENAIPFAVAIARHSAGTIHLVTVHTSPLPETVRAAPLQFEAGFDSMLVREEQEYLEALARSLGADEDVPAMSTLLEGPVPSAIARYVADTDIDLVVMSTHGHGGLRRAWLGSNADRLLHRLRVPMLLVRPLDDVTPVGKPPDFDNVLVALDGSGASEHALDAAGELPHSTTARCTLLRVAPAPVMPGSSFIPDTARDNREELEARISTAEEYLESMLPDAGRHWDKVDRHVVASYRIAEAILDEAENVEATMIALGTHGRGRVGRTVLGGVADKVVRGAHMPVLVYPARALARNWKTVRERETAAH